MSTSAYTLHGPGGVWEPIDFHIIRIVVIVSLYGAGIVQMKLKLEYFVQLFFQASVGRTGSILAGRDLT